MSARRDAARTFRGILMSGLSDKLFSLAAMVGSERNLQRLNEIAMYEATMTKADMHLAIRCHTGSDGAPAQSIYKTSQRRARKKVCQFFSVAQT